MTTEVGLDERRRALRKFRKQAGLSQWELARMSGMGQAIISRFERGDRDLSPEALTRLEKAIVDYLSGTTKAVERREDEHKLSALRQSAETKKLVHWFEDPIELKKHRLRIGLSEQEMAKRTALDVSVVLEIESGKQPLSGEIAQSLWDVISDVDSNGRDGLSLDERLERYMAAKTMEEERDILAPLTERGKGIFTSILKSYTKTCEAKREKSLEEHAEEIAALREHIKRLTSPRSLAERRADLEQRMNAADARAKVRQAEHPGPLNALSGTWTFEGSEEWGRLFEESRQLFAEEKGAEYVAAIQGQVAAKDVAIAAQAREIAALRDLLDLKTKEVLLRDALTVEREHSEEK